MAETAGRAKVRARAGGAPAIVGTAVAAVLVGLSLALLVGSAGASGQRSAGLNNTVRALAYQAGWVYAGGDFTDAGGVAAADKMARWDGSWSAVGTCPSSCVLPSWGAVYAIEAEQPTEIYAGGLLFNVAGIDAADLIARFDGTNWNAVGVPASAGRVYAVLHVGTDVYVGGSFLNFGGNPRADRLARWNGTSWTNVRSGVNGHVYALAWDNGSLYVGGRFTNAGGNPAADRIARWDGSAWSALGSGAPNQYVSALAFHGSDLYVGGWFSTLFAPGTGRIARWDGSAWSSLGGGLFNGLPQGVNALAVRGSTLYVGGSFTNAGGIADADKLAAWDTSTSTWSAVCGGGLLPTSIVYALLPVGTDDLYVGGYIEDAGGVSDADFIARCSGGTWSALN